MLKSIAVFIILVVFIFGCESRRRHKTRSTTKKYDCSSQEEYVDHDYENEVKKYNYHSEQEMAEKIKRKLIKIREKNLSKNLNRWKVIQDVTPNDEDSAEMTVSTTTPSLTIENITCKYQSNRSEHDEHDSKSTLIDYPFAVSIQKKGAHYVSGALIDKRWILTVAGEFYNVRESLKLFRARLGSVDCKKGGTLVPIKKVELHPYYIHGKPNFDVALLRMAIPVDYTDVLRPIGISNIKAKVLSAKFLTTYWPRIVIKGQTLPDTAKERIKYNSMRVSTQRLIPLDKCTKIMKAINEYINESSLCLKPVVTHHSVCMPDAGAPVIAKDGLWGITSGWTAPTCPKFPAPTIFTRLSSQAVRSWLDSQLLNI